MVNWFDLQCVAQCVAPSHLPEVNSNGLSFTHSLIHPQLTHQWLSVAVPHWDQLGFSVLPMDTKQQATRMEQDLSCQPFSHTAAVGAWLEFSTLAEVFDLNLPQCVMCNFTVRSPFILWMLKLFWFVSWFLNLPLKRCITAHFIAYELAMTVKALRSLFRL